MSKTRKIRLDMTHKARLTRKSRTNEGTTIVVGDGAQNAPQLKNLGERTLERARHTTVRMPRRRAKIHALGDVSLGGIQYAQAPKKGGRKPRRKRSPRIVPVAENSAEYHAVVNGAQSIRDRLDAARFNDADYMMFDRLQTGADWAVGGMKQFGQAFPGHKAQVDAFRREANEALPKILDALMTQNPDVPVPVLVNHAVKLLVDEAGDLFEILNLYTLAIEQYRSKSNIRMLNSLNTVMTGLFHLSQGYDLEKVCAGLPSEPLLPLSWFHFGDKIVSALIGGGLGVIPAGKAGRGALGAHLLLFQRDMPSVYGEVLGLLPHEDEHNIDNDIPGFLDEAGEVMFNRVRDDIESGKVKLTDDMIDFGGTKVKASQGLGRLAVNLLQENGADAGACRKIGSAFFKSMAQSFPALSIRRGKIADAKSKLRTNSIFDLRKLRNGKFTVVFEPHTPDYPRALQVACHLEAMGRHEEAETFRSVSHELVGSKPEFITWAPSDEKMEVGEIKIPTADVNAIMPTISDVLMNHKFKTLGGRSKLDIVNFYDSRDGKDPMRRERKAQEAAAILLAGESKLPAGVTDFFPTLVIPAAAMAYWEASFKGVPDKFWPKFEDNVIEMIELAAANCAGCK